jgi:hypothetical protein
MTDSAIMTLFHATTQKRGDRIFRDGKICRQAGPAVSWIQQTTPGWIYLSNHIDDAVHWGNKVSIMNKEDGFFYIFRVTLPLTVCYPDMDNLMYEMGMTHTDALSVDVLSSLKMCHSCRTDVDLKLTESVNGFCRLPVISYKNNDDPLIEIVRGLSGYISEEKYSSYEKFRRLIKWTSL